MILISVVGVLAGSFLFVELLVGCDCCCSDAVSEKSFRFTLPALFLGCCFLPKLHAINTPAIYLLLSAAIYHISKKRIKGKEEKKDMAASAEYSPSSVSLYLMNPNPFNRFGEDLGRWMFKTFPKAANTEYISDSVSGVGDVGSNWMYRGLVQILNHLPLPPTIVSTVP